MFLSPSKTPRVDGESTGAARYLIQQALILRHRPSRFCVSSDCQAEDSKPMHREHGRRREMKVFANLILAAAIIAAYLFYLALAK